MAVWTVFQPDDGMTDSTRGRWAERIVFVREATAWSAILFAPLVLIAHRLWLALVLYVLAQVLILLVVANLDLGDAENLLLLLPNLFVAFELSALRRRKLAARGHEEIGVVVAPNREAAERRFFESWLEAGGRPAPAVAAATRPAEPPPGYVARPPANSVIGLFPEAGR